MQKQEIVRPYLERFPDHGDLTLAKKIYKENPLVFKDVEGVRSSIRAIKGKISNYANKSLYQPKTFNSNPYKLPESEEKERVPFTLPVACNNILLSYESLFYHVLQLPIHKFRAIIGAISVMVD